MPPNRRVIASWFQFSLKPPLIKMHSCRASGGVKEMEKEKTHVPSVPTPSNRSSLDAQKAHPRSQRLRLGFGRLHGRGRRRLHVELPVEFPDLANLRGCLAGPGGERQVLETIRRDLLPKTSPKYCSTVILFWVVQEFSHTLWSQANRKEQWMSFSVIPSKSMTSLNLFI